MHDKSNENTTSTINSNHIYVGRNGYVMEIANHIFKLYENIS